MRYLIFLLFLAYIPANAQALRDINYRFLYNPAEPVHFQFEPVRMGDTWTVYYSFQVRDTTVKKEDFVLQFDVRSTLGEKEGKSVSLDSVTKINTPQRTYGQVQLPVSASVKFLTVKLLNNVLQRAWLFYVALEPNYPVREHLLAGEAPVLTPYITKNTTVSLQGTASESIVSYYNDNFPAATPGFSESLGRVSKGMSIDSTFKVTKGQPLNLGQKGLYLVQPDTSVAEGLAFRVEEDYPRLARIENLADPLIYICTKQEFEKIKQAKGEKKAFDRIILSITGDAERAKTFMRSYFRRVELANHYFTSYKEGWKTDRGMIYIIFGLPDEVFRLGDRELWNYKSTSIKVNFEFTKSSTVFDPDNYVLIRQKKYQNTWYEVIDLWRNARF
jgi:GWxTD domain-containing protein